MKINLKAKAFAFHFVFAMLCGAQSLVISAMLIFLLLNNQLKGTAFDRAFGWLELLAYGCSGISSIYYRTSKMKCSGVNLQRTALLGSAIAGIVSGVLTYSKYTGVVLDFMRYAATITTISMHHRYREVNILIKIICFLLE